MTHQDITSLSRSEEPFLGSRAVSQGLINAHRLRSRVFTPVFHNVYVPARLDMTHELRCRAAALIAPATATLTGASAAAVHGHELAAPFDPVEFVVPEDDRFSARRGIHVRRSTLGTADGGPWRGVRLATPLRATLDLLRDTQLRRSLPRAVAWLDVLLSGGFVDLASLAAYLAGRHDHGIVRARKALALADRRSQSIAESETRVWLRLAGLSPEVHVDVLGFRLELCFPVRKLAVEYGGNCHPDSGRARHDAWRRHRLGADGWKFVTVTEDQLRNDPKGMVESVRIALDRRSALLTA
jgi:very-short-patch-repair endonuclease